METLKEIIIKEQKRFRHFFLSIICFFLGHDDTKNFWNCEYHLTCDRCGRVK